MMEAIVILAGAYQLASWLLALVDAIDAPPKKAPPTSANVRRAGNPRKQQTWGPVPF